MSHLVSPHLPFKLQDFWDSLMTFEDKETEYCKLEQLWKSQEIYLPSKAHLELYLEHIQNFLHNNEEAGGNRRSSRGTLDEPVMVCVNSMGFGVRETWVSILVLPISNRDKLVKFLQLLKTASSWELKQGLIETMFVVLSTCAWYQQGLSSDSHEIHILLQIQREGDIKLNMKFKIG